MNVSFKNGLTATKYTENSGDDFWYYLIYRDVPGTYAVDCYVLKSLWSEYEITITSILESVEIGKNILSETETTDLAKTECTVPYNTTRADFDYTAGVWEIRFNTYGKNVASQTVRIDSQGELLGIVYDE